MRKIICAVVLAAFSSVAVLAFTSEELRRLYEEDMARKAAAETPEARAKAAEEAKAKTETDEFFKKLQTSFETQGFTISDVEIDQSEDFGGLVYKHYGRRFNFENRQIKNYKEWRVGELGMFRRYADPARAEAAYQSTAKSYRGDAGREMQILQGPTMRSKQYATFREETSRGGKYALAATLNYAETFYTGSNSASLTYVYLIAGYTGPYYYSARMVVKREWSTDPKDRERPGFAEVWVSEKAQVPEFDADNFPFLNYLLAALEPVTGSAPQAKVIIKLDTLSEPEMLSADSISTAVIRGCVTTRPDDASAPAVPLAGAVVGFSLTAQKGVVPGTLSVSSAAAGADGCAETVFTAPAKELLGAGAITRAAIEITADGANSETEYVNFESAFSKVSALPALPGADGPTAVIPADKVYPAKVSVYLEDINLKPMAGETVSFRIESGEPKGLLKDEGGKTGFELAAVTDERGFAFVYYNFLSTAPMDAAYDEAIVIESKSLKAPLKAVVSCGMDMAVADVRNMYEGKGQINAGESVPLVIAVEDRFHPGFRDFDAFFRYWVGVADGAPPLGIRLDITPAGNTPLYLNEQLTLKYAPNTGFSDFVTPRYLADKNVTVLWVNAGQNYAGMPKITPRFTGENRYAVQVCLADLSDRRALPEPQPLNNRAFITLNAGLAADAGKIFVLEDPFGPHTAQARLMRTVLDVAGFGAALSLTETVTLINKGDINTLAERVIDAAADALLDKITGKLSGWAASFPDGDKIVAAATLTQETVDGLESTAELIRSAELDYTPYNNAFFGTSEDDDDMLETQKTAFINAVLKKTGLKDRRIFVSSSAAAVFGDEPLVADKEGFGSARDGAVVWLKTGGRVIWLVSGSGTFSGGGQ